MSCYNPDPNCNCRQCKRTSLTYPESPKTEVIQLVKSDRVKKIEAVVKAAKSILKLKPRWDDSGAFYKPSDVDPKLKLLKKAIDQLRNKK